MRLRRPRAAPALVAVLLCLAACEEGDGWPSPELECGDDEGWAQFSRTPGHGGATCARGQPLGRILFTTAVDENAEAEKVEWNGALLAHYQTPLLAGHDVIVEHKSGTYLPCDVSGGGIPCGPDAWQLQTWGERAFRWRAGVLQPAWSFDSDWKPPAHGPALQWEPVFHAALFGEGGSLVAVPGAGGALHVLDRTTGRRLRTVDPFAADPDTFVAGAVGVDGRGDAWYTAVRLDPVDPFGAAGRDPEGWLVRVSPDGQFAVASFADLVTGAPGPDDACETGYPAGTPRPLPPLDDQGVPLPAPTVRCGPQRPSLNAAPAFAEDGTVFVVSRAHRAARTSFVVAVRPDLTPRWAASFRGRLTDGCGVLRLDCNPGAPAGVDPGTGTLPAGMVDDLSTSSPVALPDGGVLYGAYTGYNGSRGHLFRFGAGGEFLASYDFGWDITPAVFPHGGTWSVVLKDNHYPVGPYHLTQLDAELRVEWQVANPETRSCRREENGAVTCLDTGEHPLGFEWCVNAVAVDREGVVYANAEDGFLYAIDQGGRVRDRIFLSLALGSAYTPVSLDAEGRIYAQNDGKLFVVGRRGPTRTK